jgi:hypothetical protein
MKMIDGAASFAFANRSRTRDAPIPTIASMNSEAAIEKKAACASPATARAMSVLPVPGAPKSRTPWGIRAPRRTYRSGVLRKSTISVSSAFASSIPATSSNVTLIFVGSARRACERPKLPSPPRPLDRARLRRNQKRATKSSVGPNPSRISASSDLPGFGFWALTWTPFSWSSFVSAVLSQNVGTSVEKRVVGVVLPPGG